VGGQDFAFNIFQVERILRYEAPAPVAEGARFLEGRAALSGRCHPARRPAQRLGSPAPLREDTRTASSIRGRARSASSSIAVTEVMQVSAQAVTPAAGYREGVGGGVHRRARGAERPDDRRPEYEQAAELEGKIGAARSHMTESLVAHWRREYDEIARQLEGAPGTPSVKPQARDHRVLQESRHELGELTQLKDDIRQLVDRYKQIARTRSRRPRRVHGQRPVLHADHIGATTFHRKRLEPHLARRSLGRYLVPAAALQLSPGETQAESLLGWAQMLHEDYDDALGTSRRCS